MYEAHILSLQKTMRFYEKNVFILNRKALIIQHWYFSTIATKEPIQPKKANIIKVKKRSPYKKEHTVERSPERIQIERVEQILPPKESPVDCSVKLPANLKKQKPKCYDKESIRFAYNKNH